LLFLHYRLTHQSLVHHLIDRFVQKNHYYLLNLQNHQSQQLLFLGFHLLLHRYLHRQHQLKYLLHRYLIVLHIQSHYK
jgi:hypothetical protein